MIEVDGAEPGAGFSTMPVISNSEPLSAPIDTTPYWCVWSSGTSSTAMTLPPWRS